MKKEWDPHNGVPGPALRDKDKSVPARWTGGALFSCGGPHILWGSDKWIFFCARE